MRFSSITIRKGGKHEFYHNDRSRPTKHSIFTQENNRVSAAGKEALEEWEKDVKFFKALWIEQHKRRMPKTTNTLLSAIVNLDERHTIEDLEKVGKFLSDYLGVKIYQVALHRDEGYVDENGKPHINHHGHILMSGIRINENGIVESVSKLLKRNALKYIHKKTAEILNMPMSFVKSGRRLDTDEYKMFVEKNKEIVALNKKLREENYKLSREVNLYMNETLEKDKRIEELKENNDELKERIKELRQKLREADEKYNLLFEKAMRVVKKLRKKYLLIKLEKLKKENIETVRIKK